MIWSEDINTIEDEQIRDYLLLEDKIQNHLALMHWDMISKFKATHQVICKNNMFDLVQFISYPQDDEQLRAEIIMSDQRELHPYCLQLQAKLFNYVASCMQVVEHSRRITGSHNKEQLEDYYKVKNENSSNEHYIVQKYRNHATHCALLPLFVNVLFQPNQCAYKQPIQFEIDNEKIEGKHETKAGIISTEVLPSKTIIIELINEHWVKFDAINSALIDNLINIHQEEFDKYIGLVKKSGEFEKVAKAKNEVFSSREWLNSQFLEEYEKTKVRDGKEIK
jgi:hypothetical protein